MAKLIVYLTTTGISIFIVVILYTIYQRRINTFKDSIAYLNKMYNMLRNVNPDKYFDFLLDYYECKSLEMKSDEIMELMQFVQEGNDNILYYMRGEPLCILDKRKGLFIYVKGDYSKEKVLMEFHFVLKRIKRKYIDTSMYIYYANDINSFVFRSIQYAFNNFQ